MKMKEIIKKISIVASIMLIALGGCVSCTSDEDWWLCLIPAAIGILILLSIYISEKIKNNKMHKQQDKIIIDNKFITVNTNQNTYRFLKEKSDFDTVLDELKDKQQEVSNGKV